MINYLHRLIKRYFNQWKNTIYPEQEKQILEQEKPIKAVSIFPEEFLNATHQEMIKRGGLEATIKI